MAQIDPQVAAALRLLDKRSSSLQSLIQQQSAMIAELQTRPRTITEEIDQIPGRRIETVLSGEVNFTATDEGKRGNPILIQVSSDGPFIMTHYPMALWRPIAPVNATNYQLWRPVSSYPLPTQVIGTDIIDIMYELQDGGSQRNFQNAPRAPLFSRPDNIVPCAVPTLWAPNAAIGFYPTYNKLTWNSATPPTQGTLHIDLIGYRVVNL
ncbi:MAG: hypothetical protein ABIO35_10890 [Nitrobacter sp.]